MRHARRSRRFHRAARLGHGELRGYHGKDDVPGYRQMPLPIYVDAIEGNGWIKGQQISASYFPDWFKDELDKPFVFRHGVGEIEAMIKSCEEQSKAGLHLSLPMAPELARVLDKESGNPFQHTMEVYWYAHVTALCGIVDQIRTTLAEMVAETRADLPPHLETPSTELADQAVSVAIHGKSGVTINAAQASGTATAEVGPPQAEERSPFWTRSKKIGAIVVGAAGVVSAAVGVIQWLY